MVDGKSFPSATLIVIQIPLRRTAFFPAPCTEAINAGWPREPEGATGQQFSTATTAAAQTCADQHRLPGEPTEDGCQRQSLSHDVEFGALQR